MDKKKAQFLALIGLLLVLIGMVGGVCIGSTVQKKVDTNKIAELEKENEKLSVIMQAFMTQTPDATTAPEATQAPEITEAPDATIAPDATTAPEATDAPDPTQEMTPTLPPATIAPTPEPTQAPELTNVPTKAPDPTSVPDKVVTPAAGGSGISALHVQGTKLCDENNQTVILRGISSHGLGWFPEYINETAIRQFAQEWGCNVIRLAMYTEEYNGYCSSNQSQKDNLKKIVDTGVKAAVANNMYVIIDWHILQDGNPNKNKEEALKFFDEVSKKYAAYPNVLYEICNEPNGSTTWKDVKKYALEVIPVIRKNAPNAVIIVGSPTWSQDVDLAAQDPITEYKNIAYSLHFYAATHKQSLRDKAKKAISKGLCLLVTEYGVCDASGNGALDLKEANTWIDFLNANGIGYIAWNLSNKAETSSMLKSSCKKVNGFTKSDLSEGGVWFLDMLKKQAGGLGADKTGSTEAGKQDDSGSQIDSTTGSENGSTAGGNSVENEYSEIATKYLKPDKNVEYMVEDGWDSGDCADIKLKITIINDSAQDVTNWVRKITVTDPSKVRLKGKWNVEATLKDGVLTLKPESYNSTIGANSTVQGIGVILEIDY